MSNWQRVVILWVMLFFFTQVQGAKPLAPKAVMGVTIVSAQEVIELILAKPEIVIIDSRYHEEYTKGHIEGAVNILNSDMTIDDLQQLTGSPLTPLLFYCNGERCLRSSNAASKAVKWGYKKIYWFREGWLDWVNKQYPIEY